MSAEKAEHLKLSAVEQRLADIIGPQLVLGGRFILENYPQVLGSLTTVEPRIERKIEEVPTGVAPVPFRTAEESEELDVHPNVDIDEAIAGATLFSWAKHPDLASFTTDAALHRIPVRNHVTETTRGTGRMRLEERLVDTVQLQPMRYLLVDESLSMAGGADILTELITTAYLLDCGKNGIPLIVRHFNKPPAEGKTEVSQMTKMESPLDLEQAALTSVANYKPDGLTIVSEAIFNALSDLSTFHLAKGQVKEIVITTDGELLANQDAQEKLNPVVRLAHDQGINVKVVYLQDPNISPAGPEALEKAGCQLATLSLEIIKNLPEEVKKFVLERTKIRLVEIETIALRDITEKVPNILTYLCGLTALYLTSGGGALYLSKGVDPQAPGINIPPWHESLPADQLDLYLALTIGLQALTLFLLFRKRVQEYLPVIIEVPEVIRQLEEIKLYKGRVRLQLQRLLEPGTILIKDGEQIITKKGDKWVSKGCRYQVV